MCHIIYIWWAFPPVIKYFKNTYSIYFFLPFQKFVSNNGIAKTSAFHGTAKFQGIKFGSEINPVITWYAKYSAGC